MRPLVLLTDFGLADHYAGVLHAVIEREAPGAVRIDLTHEIPPGDVWAACFTLRAAWPHLPEDAVVLAVVDPGVGTARRAVAAHAGGRWLVAPDNGLAAAAGPADRLVVLDAAAMGIPAPSATFHGRDLFAPAAARLARGDDPSALGREEAPTLAPVPLPEPVREAGGTVRGAVLHVDRFGNVVTNVPAALVPPGAAVRCGRAVVTRRVRTYGEAPPGVPVMLEGSTGLLEIALDGEPAAARAAIRRAITSKNGSYRSRPSSEAGS